MGAMAFQIISLTIVYSTVYLGIDQRKSKLRVTGFCVLFRNGHARAKHGKSFRDFKWLCQLDEVKVSQTRQICSRDEFITIMVVKA